MLQATALLNGQPGRVIDRGERACYWEAQLGGVALQSLLDIARHKRVTSFVSGDKQGVALVQGCWYNVENNSVLVKFQTDAFEVGELPIFPNERADPAQTGYLDS